jgi:hypothetical protein
MMRTKRDISKLIWTVFLLLVLTTFSTALSASNAEWSEPVNLSGWREDLSSIHHLEMSEDGRQVAFWVGYQTNKQWSIWARVRPPGGDWEPAHNVSGWMELLDDPPGIHGYDVGMTPWGEAWAIWAEQVSQQPGDNIWVKGARCSPEECTWQVENVSDWPEGFIRDVDISIGIEGHLAVSWVACAGNPSTGGGPCAVYVKRRFPGATGWEPLERLDGSSGMAIWSVNTLVGPGGLTFVQWWEDSPYPPEGYLKTGAFGKTFVPASGTWDGSSYTPLSGWKEGLVPSDPVMDPSGTVITAWSELITKSPYTYNNYSRTRSSASGTWSSPTKISQDNKIKSKIFLAVGHNGTVLAVTVKGRPGSTSEFAWFATVRDAGSTWGSEIQLSDWISSGHTYPALGVWPDGTCLVTWNMLDSSRGPNQDEAMFWNTRPPNSSWAGQGRLSLWYDSVDNPNLDLGHNGSAVLTWATKDADQAANQQTVIMATHYPPGGPWTDPIAISDWDKNAMMFPMGLAVHPEGQPIGAVWYQYNNVKGSGFFYSQFGAEEEVVWNKVYLPMVAR